MIPLHNRYAYSAITKRPTYTWPEGKRLAFWIGTNVELYAFQAGIGNDPDRKSTRLNSSHIPLSRMPSSA